ncbi:hypothetical protein RFI_35199, partial [Reticulomyxa filosa]
LQSQQKETSEIVTQMDFETIGVLLSPTVQLASTVYLQRDRGITCSYSSDAGTLLRPPTPPPEAILQARQTNLELENNEEDNKNDMHGNANYDNTITQKELKNSNIEANANGVFLSKSMYHVPLKQDKMDQIVPMNGNDSDDDNDNGDGHINGLPPPPLSPAAKNEYDDTDSDSESKEEGKKMLSFNAQDKHQHTTDVESEEIKEKSIHTKSLSNIDRQSISLRTATGNTTCMSSSKNVPIYFQPPSRSFFKMKNIGDSTPASSQLYSSFERYPKIIRTNYATSAIQHSRTQQNPDCFSPSFDLRKVFCRNTFSMQWLSMFVLRIGNIST